MQWAQKLIAAGVEPIDLPLQLTDAPRRRLTFHLQLGLQRLEPGANERRLFEKIE